MIKCNGKYYFFHQDHSFDNDINDYLIVTPIIQVRLYGHNLGWVSLHFSVLEPDIGRCCIIYYSKEVKVTQVFHIPVDKAVL